MPMRTDNDAAMTLARRRRQATLDMADAEGLLGQRDRSVGSRVPSKLLDAARAASGVDSVSDLLVYALSRVALEDDFGPGLVARRGSVPRGSLEG